MVCSVDGKLWIWDKLTESFKYKSIECIEKRIWIIKILINQTFVAEDNKCRMLQINKICLLFLFNQILQWNKESSMIEIVSVLAMLFQW